MVKKPILIAIEGNDCSGKETQAKRLAEHLNKKGIKTKMVSFPIYDDSSALEIKRYLAGEIELTPYQAGKAYAYNRYATLSKWYDEEYDVIVLDRYVGSNLTHQTLRVPEIQRGNLIDTFLKLEHKVFSIPKADLTIFLDMPLHHSLKLNENRPNKITGGQEKDIHESEEFMAKAYHNGITVKEYLQWDTVKCGNKRSIFEIESISEDVIKIAEEFLKEREII